MKAYAIVKCSKICDLKTERLPIAVILNSSAF